MSKLIDTEGSRAQGLNELNARSREIFRHIVEAYVETGAPIGSRTLSRKMGMELSPATIRNIMADLEEAGLLFAPHTSAGRLPTDAGLSLFVHGLLEHGNLNNEQQRQIEGQCLAKGRGYSEVLEEAGSVLSQLSRCAGLVVAPKVDEPLRHIEFVALGPGRALVVMVTDSGKVENRVIDVPVGLPPSSLVQASNFLTARLVGRSLGDAQNLIQTELSEKKAQLDDLTARLVESGLATWSEGNADRGGALIVRGQAQLLEDITAIEDLERVRQLFAALEARETMLRLLNLTEDAEGVQIFIGTENELFGMANCSMVVAPYQNSQQQIVGAIGVIGPTRMDYGRIIPIVDYTAKVIGRLVG